MSELIRVYIRHMQAAGFSPHTIRGRRRLLEAADKWLPHGIETVTADELADFLTAASDPDSPWTRRTYYTYISAFYAWAASGPQPHLDWNPATELMKVRSPEEEPNPVSDDELRHALEHSGDYWRLAVTLGAYAGLRCGDMCRIRREDVTAETILVRRGKGNKTALLPTHATIWQLVRDRAPGLLLSGRNGRQRTSAVMSSAARKHFDKIGLPEVSLHRFRHWHATALLRAGSDVRVVQSLMRHSSLATTARYLAIADGQRQMAIGSLPALTAPHQDAA